jgi:hypothetical protein
MINYKKHPASYRDPAGFIFEYEGKFYRQVNNSYAEHYELLKKSGLYDLLVKEKKILAHTELNQNFTGDAQWHTTLLPVQLNFIAYPYEWCFSQWKDAALLTLDIVKTSMKYGMILKDATPFNIQFVHGAPVLIDSLSFEKYDVSKPWVAYRQFVECFIGPLLLAKYNTAEMLKIFQVYPDGIPLPVISKLLPFKSMLNANIFLHIGLPGLLNGNKNKAQKKQAPFTQQKLSNIISNLYSFVRSLELPSSVTKWNNYYEETILSSEYAEAKMVIIKNWLQELPVQTVLDIGTNTGLFALAAAGNGRFTVAVDADTACIDTLYNECRQKNISCLIPLCVDITNPSPSIGWNNAERLAFSERVQTDLTMALALVHHLAIGKNVSFQQLAETFSRFSPWLIIEFVPKNDPKVQLLLKQREDIFTGYTIELFETAFRQHFSIIQSISVPGTFRMLYLMKRN